MNKITTKKGTELPLLNLKGKDYLQVAHRLVWFREDHPDWSIKTEYVYQDDKSALAKATILNESGREIAMAHKEESRADFPAGYREKAETGAIGRALALCAYGTQFEPELDEGERIVDSPVSKTAPWIEQPAPGEFQEINEWRFNFGKFKSRTIEQVYRDQGGHVLGSYCDFLIDSAKKKGEPLGAAAAEAVTRIEEFLGAMENAKPHT